jgi:hypothetical protein
MIEFWFQSRANKFMMMGNKKNRRKIPESLGVKLQLFLLCRERDDTTTPLNFHKQQLWILSNII